VSRPQQVDHPGFEGWFFEDGYFCSPAGDRFSPTVIMCCFFWKQMSEVQSLWQTGSMRQDAPLIRTEKGPGKRVTWEIERRRSQGSVAVGNGNQPLAADAIPRRLPGTESNQ
jgi:hypothetical protein